MTTMTSPAVLCYLILAGQTGSKIADLLFGSGYRNRTRYMASVHSCWINMMKGDLASLSGNESSRRENDRASRVRRCQTLCTIARKC